MRKARILLLFFLSLGLALPACAAGKKSAPSDSFELNHGSEQNDKQPLPLNPPQSQTLTATPAPQISVSPSPIRSVDLDTGYNSTGTPKEGHSNPALVRLQRPKLPAPNSSRSAADVKQQPVTRPSPQPTPRPSQLRMSAASSLPEELVTIEALYKESGTVTANFTQVSRSAATGIEKTTFGKIQIKQPNLVRWETTDPDPSLLVSNGKKFWFYTPPFDASDGGQVIIKKASQVQSRLAHALIAGAFSQSSVSREVRFEKRSKYQFLLIPKPGRAGTVKSALIEIHPKDKRINKVILDHRDGNHAEILLQRIELGAQLPDSVFQFVPPKGTIVIDPDHE